MKTIEIKLNDNLNQKIAKELIKTNDSSDLIALRFNTTLERVKKVEKGLKDYL